MIGLAGFSLAGPSRPYLVRSCDVAGSFFIFFFFYERLKRETLEVSGRGLDG